MFERLLTSFQNIVKIPELRTRILFTIGMLVVYRIGAHIPTPGINGEALSEFLQKEGGALLGFLDIFSGGSLSRLTILALGIMPYITASIILQLLTVVYEPLAKLQKEGELGRKKIMLAENEMPGLMSLRIPSWKTCIFPFITANHMASSSQLERRKRRPATGSW